MLKGRLDHFSTSLEIQAFISACAKRESLDLCYGWPGLKVGVNPSRWASLKKSSNWSILASLKKLIRDKVLEWYSVSNKCYLPLVDSITALHQGGGGETVADGQIGEPIRARAFLSRDLPLKARMQPRWARLCHHQPLIRDQHLTPTRPTNIHTQPITVLVCSACASNNGLHFYSAFL